MSATGLETFDTTLQKTSIWLNEVMDEMHWEDRQKAYLTLRAVLHALRDRLMVNEAAHLGAQLPMLVRGFYFEGWRPAGKPLNYRKKEEFLAHVKEKLPGVADSDLEAAVGAVFHVLSEHVEGGEIDEVKHQLPEPIRELWH